MAPSARLKYGSLLRCKVCNRNLATVSFSPNSLLRSVKGGYHRCSHVTLASWQHQGIYIAARARARGRAKARV